MSRMEWIICKNNLIKPLGKIFAAHAHYGHCHLWSWPVISECWYPSGKRIGDCSYRSQKLSKSQNIIQSCLSAQWTHAKTQKSSEAVADASPSLTHLTRRDGVQTCIMATRKLVIKSACGSTLVHLSSFFSLRCGCLTAQTKLQCCCGSLEHVVVPIYFWKNMEAVWCKVLKLYFHRVRCRNERV